MEQTAICWLAWAVLVAAHSQCNIEHFDSLSVVQIGVEITQPTKTFLLQFNQTIQSVRSGSTSSWILHPQVGAGNGTRWPGYIHRLPKAHHNVIAIAVFCGFSVASVVFYCFSFVARGNEEPTNAAGEAITPTSGLFRNKTAPPNMQHQQETSSSSNSVAEKHERSRRATLSARPRVLWYKKQADHQDHCPQMTFWQFVFTIVADLCPCGFLSLAFGLGGVGYFWALFIMIVFLLFATFTMWTVGMTSVITRKSDFTSQWIEAVGNGGHWIPMVIVIIVSYGALVCYACYFGDLLEEVLPAFGFPLPRFSCIICFSLFPALPLCLLKDFSALSASSTFAFLSMVYTAIVMLIRTFDGTYILGGEFYMDVMPSLRGKPMHEKHVFNFSSSRSLIFINILAMAFHCHCNACKYYRELANNTPRYFGKATFTAMSVSGIIYAVTAFAGYRTFGSACDGTILTNYSGRDWPVNIARILLSLSLVASYAIMFSAFREAFISGVQEILGERGRGLNLIWRQDVISVILVCLVTICAVVCADSGTVDGFIGAFCGNAIIYIIPCFIFLFATRNLNVINIPKWNIILCIFLVFLGIALAVAGSLSLGFYEFEGEENRRVGHSGKGVVVKGIPTFEDAVWRRNK